MHCRNLCDAVVLYLTGVCFLGGVTSDFKIFNKVRISRVEVWLVPNPFVLFIDLSCVYYLSLETTHIIIILQRDPSPHDGDSVDIMLEFSLY